MTPPRKKLSDILNGGGDGIRAAWNSTTAKGGDGPLPRGAYVCHAMSWEVRTSRTNGTPGVLIIFQVIEGDYAGRRIWHDLWLTEAAMPRTKRGLAKFGVTEMEQLERPMPPGFRCRVEVVIRQDNDGIHTNNVRHFEVICVDENPFPPPPATGGIPGSDGHPEIPV